LVTAGACLLGEPPVATPGLTDLPQADEELRALSATIWGNSDESDRPLGKGRVFRGISTEEALKRLGVNADFTGPPELTWIHRRKADTDIYFIATSSDHATVPTCSFRVSGKQAELWDPETGEIRMLDTTSSADGMTQAELPLGPDGSAFIVFRSRAQQISSTGKSPADPRDSTPTASREIQGPWNLAFPAESGAPLSLLLDPLVSWSVHADPNVRHFSGTAVYTNQFEISDLKSQITLNLGRVEIMARVKLNGKDLGILWKPPYQIDITKAAVPGTNHLEISVVNLWVNRLIGDAALQEDSERDKNGNLTAWPPWALEGKTSPTGRKSFVTFPLWKKNEALRNSGLLGPVTLRSSTPLAAVLETD
jgi:hypothetical protein